MSAPVKLRPIPLWEEGGWNRKALQRKKANTPPSSFARGWWLLAADEGDYTFPGFRDCYTPGLPLGLIQRRHDWPTVTGVDLSGKKRPGNAIVTVRVDPTTQRRYPVDLRAGAWRSHETVAQLAEVNATFGPSVIKVEDNGYQESLIDWIEVTRADFWHKVEATTTTGATKHSEEVGLQALQVEFQNHAWVIPSDEFESHPPGHMTKGCMWCRWAHEFTQHPLAQSSDFVMATWFARQGIEQIGFTIGAEDLPPDLRSR